MALSPIVSVPIAWQTSLVDVQPTSRAGAESDTAFVYTTLALESGESRRAVCVLPLAAPAAAEPRAAVLPGGESTPFRQTTLEGAEEALGRVARSELWAHAREHAQGGIWTLDLDLDRDARLLRIVFAQTVPQLDGGGFELTLLAPLASFLPAPGGPATVAVALPRPAEAVVTLHGGHIEQPPGLPVSSATDEELARRRFLGYVWQEPDALLRVRYAYRAPA